MNYSLAKKILVIDDESMLRYTLRELLLDLGYEVVEASHGKEGLEILERSQIDLVLLDMVMPVMSGMEVLYKMRDLQYQIPVVLSSGRARNLDLKELQDLGVEGVLKKPYRMSQLADLLGNIETLKVEP